jgi:hypothetical protein
MGSEVLRAVVMKISIFWYISGVVCWKSTDVSEKYVACIFRVEYAKEITSMKQAASSSETSVDFKQTTRRHIPEARRSQ